MHIETLLRRKANAKICCSVGALLESAVVNGLNRRGVTWKEEERPLIDKLNASSKENWLSVAYKFEFVSLAKDY